LADWNPAGIAVDDSANGPFVYATGPAPANGATVRIGPPPDFTLQTVLNRGGQGLALDEAGNLYMAQPGDGVYLIPDAKHGTCGVPDKPGDPPKDCHLLIADGGLDCNGDPIHLTSPYALALAGGILYVTGQLSNNVLRRPVQTPNSLGLPLCVQEIFK